MNPRCVHFARVNAVLNGFGDRVETRVSDIFSAVLEDELFDAIYVNPPFVPAPFEPRLLPTVMFSYLLSALAFEKYR